MYNLRNEKKKSKIDPKIILLKVWLDGLRKITHNVKANNFCPMTCLKKQ